MQRESSEMATIALTVYEKKTILFVAVYILHIHKKLKEFKCLAIPSNHRYFNLANKFPAKTNNRKIAVSPNTALSSSDVCIILMLFGRLLYG